MSEPNRGTTEKYGVVFNEKLLPGRLNLAGARVFVQMGNPACTYQIVELVDTPEALGFDEFRRRYPSNRNTKEVTE